MQSILYRKQRHPLLWAVAVVFLAVALTLSFAWPAAATTFEIKMGSDTGQLVFVPDALEIHQGDTVKWVMNKVPPHNVVFEGDKIPGADKALAQQLSHKQLLFAPGDSYESTFTADLTTGIYPYYCEPHRAAGMAGKIIVKE
jgi:plastocyanin